VLGRGTELRVGVHVEPDLVPLHTTQFDGQHLGLPARVDLQRRRAFQVWPPLEEPLCCASERDMTTVVVTTDGQWRHGWRCRQSMARINAVQQRQAFSQPFLNTKHRNSPTLQPHPG
jgi:hypothetical protein